MPASIGAGAANSSIQRPRAAVRRVDSRGRSPVFPHRLGVRRGERGSGARPMRRSDAPPYNPPRWHASPPRRRVSGAWTLVLALAPWSNAGRRPGGRAADADTHGAAPDGRGSGPPGVHPRQLHQARARDRDARRNAAAHRDLRPQGPEPPLRDPDAAHSVQHVALRRRPLSPRRWGLRSASRATASSSSTRTCAAAFSRRASSSR